MSESAPIDSSDNEASAAVDAAGADRLRELAASARLFGRLLVCEIDAPLLTDLREPRLAEALDRVGVHVPANGNDSLDQLATEYFRLFVNPSDGGPLVQSLYQGGTYEGASAAGARRLAEAAGVTLDRDAARGAPPDHLGCLLQLWARVAERSPGEAGLIARTYLTWAVAPLRRRAVDGGGFYPELAEACARLIELIVSTTVQDEPGSSVMT